jgi:PTH1 family peptidyl-tRNA hydrolase
MKIIVGLGNPGEKYDSTRHNLGFVVLDHLLKKYEPVKESSWDDNKKTKSLIKKVTIGNNSALLSKPLTYMNNSGMAVSLLLEYFKVKPEELIVIHDDLDLPMGKIQVRFGGGSAGHNGLESIIASIKTDKFLRIRMGIGKPMRIEGSKFDQKRHHSIEEYVLLHFPEGEHKDVRNMTKHVQKQLELVLEHGIKNYMSKFNVKS